METDDFATLIELQKGHVMLLNDFNVTFHSLGH